MKRILFVGIHNKPGLKPLESSTLTGKLVDFISAGFPNSDIVKTNLFDTEILPPDFLNNRLLWVKDWKTRVGYKPGNIVVALGQVVQLHLKNYSDIPEKEIVSIPHPAFRNREPDYVKCAIQKIREALR